MSAPPPPVPLQDHCSIIQGNTLYVYSPAAFQALPLQANATWSELPNGVSVTGAVCAQGVENGPGSDPALWVVGGSANSSMQDYTGLQRYSFTSKTWQTVTLITEVTKNRTNHGAVWMDSTATILVYSGSQTGSTIPSLETFVLETTPPFNVLSFSSKNIPVSNPTLLRWNESAAITVGGAGQNRDVNLFNAQAGGWSSYGTSLAAPLKGLQQEQSTLIIGDDGSKVLEVYDLSVSPNQVSRTVLQDANGQPAQTGQMVGQSSSAPAPTKKRKRDRHAPVQHKRRELTLANWPAYNNSAAPTYTRNGFSLAQSPQGLVALSGGNDQHPVALFNEATNSWLDSSQFFGIKDNNAQSVLIPSATSSTNVPSSTPTSTPSSSAEPLPVVDGNHTKTSTILGATLGSILGLIALLVAVLLFVRFRRRKQAKAVVADNGDEKRRLSFADRGAPFMMEGADRPGNANHDSIAIMSGNLNSNHRRMDTRGSDSSTTRLVPRKGPLGAQDSMEMTTIQEKGLQGQYLRTTTRDETLSPNTAAVAAGRSPNQRTSGWSRYFSSNSEPSVVGVAAGQAPRKSGGYAASERTSADTYSNYTMASNVGRASHETEELPPLKLGLQFDSSRISRVVTGTPPQSPPSSDLKRLGTTTSNISNISSFRDSRPRTTESRFSRPRTMSSDVSSRPVSTIDDTVFGHNHSKTEESNQWTPMTKSDWTAPRSRNTATSSIYTDKGRDSGALTKGLTAVLESGRSRGMVDSRASDPDTWPRPPSNYRSRQSAALEEYDDEDVYIHDQQPPDTPTATTAIPIPASTAMQYTVTKPKKPISNEDM